MNTDENDSINKVLISFIAEGGNLNVSRKDYGNDRTYKLVGIIYCRPVGGMAKETYAQLNRILKNENFVFFFDSTRKTR